MTRPDKTVIGPSITIEGEIDSDDAVVVQGRISGKLTCAQDVTIETEAEVEAEVSAETLVVSGRLDGPAVAKVRVELTSHGRMSGDISSPRIQIADGAQYKGNVDMS